MAGNSEESTPTRSISAIRRLSGSWRLALAGFGLTLVGAVLLAADESYASSRGDLDAYLDRAHRETLEIIPVVQRQALDYYTADYIKGYHAAVEADRRPSSIVVTYKSQNLVLNDTMKLWTEEQKASLHEDQREHLKAILHAKLASIATRAKLRLVDQGDSFEIHSNALIASRAALTFTGLLLILAAVGWRLKLPLGRTIEDRSKPAGLIALAAAACVIAFVGLQGWDSIQLFLGVMTVVAVAAAVIVLLPLLARKVAISCLVLLHFSGILTAVTAVQAHNEVPWLPTWLWARVYRPYLSFGYMNNAYHFYSPEPGPPTAAWFLVEYRKGDDVKREWVQLTTREQCATRLQYQRYFALTESMNRRAEISPVKIDTLWYRRGMVDARDITRKKKGDEVGAVPQAAEAVQTDVDTDESPIQLPGDPRTTYYNQYHEPNEQAKAYVESYVRHVAKSYPCKADPSYQVDRIKVYKLIHNMLDPSILVKGMDPRHPVQYEVYFMGEFSPDGTLKQPRVVRNGAVTEDVAKVTYVLGGQSNWQAQSVVRANAQDLYLYWRIPVYALPRPDLKPDEKANPVDPRDWYLHDWLTVHAGKMPPGHWAEIVAQHPNKGVPPPSVLVREPDPPK